MTRTIHIYTDGACSNNGRANASAGWAAILVNPEGEHLKISGKLTGDEITNNRAELTAVIEGLSALKRPADVILTTDSKYVADGATTWLESWKRNGVNANEGCPDFINSDCPVFISALSSIPIQHRVRCLPPSSWVPSPARPDACPSAGNSLP